MLRLLLPAVIALVAFGIVLENVSSGQRSTRLASGLRIVLLAAIICAFWLLGWKVGAASFAVGWLVLAFARPVARRIIDKPTPTVAQTGGIGPIATDRELERLSRGVDRPHVDFDTMVESIRRGDANPWDAVFAHCLGRLEVQRILAEFGAGPEDLVELSQNLRTYGAGQWRGGHFVAASAIALAEPLRFLLSGRRAGLSYDRQTSALLDYFEFGTPLSADARDDASRL